MMEMEIEIQEENNQQLLSKTQKQKIRRLVKQVWTTEEDFYDHLDEILTQIHYDPIILQEQQYNHIEHNLKNERHLVLFFKRIHMETPEERRNKLIQKLKNTIQQKKHASFHPDPQTQAYQQLCQRLPKEQQNIIPKPSQVKENIDMYRQMMTMIPRENPLHQYLSLFMN